MGEFGKKACAWVGAGPQKATALHMAGCRQVWIGRYQKPECFQKKLLWSNPGPDDCQTGAVAVQAQVKPRRRHIALAYMRGPLCGNPSATARAEIQLTNVGDALPATSIRPICDVHGERVTDSAVPPGPLSRVEDVIPPIAGAIQPHPGSSGGAPEGLSSSKKPSSHASFRIIDLKGISYAAVSTLCVERHRIPPAEVHGARASRNATGVYVYAYTHFSAFGEVARRKPVTAKKSTNYTSFVRMIFH